MIATNCSKKLYFMNKKEDDIAFYKKMDAIFTVLKLFFGLSLTRHAV